jgi:hypothetical protein
MTVEPNRFDLSEAELVGFVLVALKVLEAFDDCSVRCVSEKLGIKEDVALKIVNVMADFELASITEDGRGVVREDIRTAVKDVLSRLLG